MLGSRPSRRITISHHHHNHEQLQALCMKFPHVYDDVISSIDIVSILSIKYPDVYNEINGSTTSRCNDDNYSISNNNSN